MSNEVIELSYNEEIQGIEYIYPNSSNKSDYLEVIFLSSIHSISSPYLLYHHPHSTSSSTNHERGRDGGDGEEEFLLNIYVFNDQVEKGGFEKNEMMMVDEMRYLFINYVEVEKICWKKNVLIFINYM